VTNTKHVLRTALPPLWNNLSEFRKINEKSQAHHIFPLQVAQKSQGANQCVPP
jgi:hypothetical protein